MPVAINQYQAPKNNVLEGILTALQAAHTYYGVSAAKDTAAQVAKLNDPTSQESQYARAQEEAGYKFAENKGLLTHEQTSKLTNMVEGIQPNGQPPTPMSALSLQKEPEKNMLAGLMKGEQAAQAMKGRAQGFNDRNAIQVSNQYESTMKPFRAMNENLARLESTLSTKDKEGNPLVTKQQVGDSNALVAQIYSPNHMSDATISRTEYESVPSQWAGAIQKVFTNPRDVQSRALLDHMIDQARHITNTSNQNALRELDSLDSGFTNLSSPQAVTVARAKSDDFRKRFSVRFPEVGSQMPGTGSSAQSGGGMISDANAAGDNSDDEMVSVMSPQGVPGKLPKSQVDFAVKTRGFKIQ